MKVQEVMLRAIDGRLKWDPIRRDLGDLGPADAPLEGPLRQVKFVVADRRDYEWAMGMMAEHALAESLVQQPAVCRVGGSPRNAQVQRRQGWFCTTCSCAFRLHPTVVEALSGA